MILELYSLLRSVLTFRVSMPMSNQLGTLAVSNFGFKIKWVICGML